MLPYYQYEQSMSFKSQVRWKTTNPTSWQNRTPDDFHTTKIVLVFLEKIAEGTLAVL